MIVVLLNPASGVAETQDRFARVAVLFDAAGADAQIVQLRSGAEAPDAARSAVSHGAAAVVAGGGDGTVSSVASVLVGSNTPLGVLPLGTLNHFAKDVRIPLDLEGAVATVVAGHVTGVDVGEVNGRTFINNASIGVYPDIVVEREKLRKQGYRKWIAFALATARILRRYRGLVVRLTAEDATVACADGVSLRRQQPIRDRRPRPRCARQARRRPAGGVPRAARARAGSAEAARAGARRTRDGTSRARVVRRRRAARPHARTPPAARRPRRRGDRDDEAAPRTASGRGRCG